MLLDLSSHRYNHSSNSFTFINIESALQAKLFEVESVTLVVVSADCLGVVVHNDTLDSISAKLPYC